MTNVADHSYGPGVGQPMRRKPHFLLLGVPVRLRRIAVLPGVVMGLLIYALLWIMVPSE